jgi:hypothetical protein
MLERSEGLADWAKHHIHKIQASAHGSDRSFDQSSQLWHLSHLDIHYRSRSQNNSNSIQCRLSGKIVFFMLVAYREFFSLMITSILIILVPGLICVVPFLEFLMFVLILADGLCLAWSAYPILCYCRCLEIGTSSINWAQLSRFHLKMETESSLQNVVF